MTDVGGRGIAEGLKGNSSVTEVDVSGNEGISDAVKREIAQGLVDGHGVDKGRAAACVFYDFETCEGVNLKSKQVRCMTC